MNQIRVKLIIRDGIKTELVCPFRSVRAAYDTLGKLRNPAPGGTDMGLYVHWDAPTETWTVGVLDGGGYGTGPSLTEAYRDLVECIGYDPRDGDE